MSQPCGHYVCGWFSDGACHIQDRDLPRRVLELALDEDEVLRNAEAALQEAGTHPETRRAIEDAIAVLKRQRGK